MSKKIFAVVLSLVMLFALATPAFAADVNASNTASVTTLKRGEEVTVTIAVTDSLSSNSIGIDLVDAFDATVFEAVKGEWLLTGGLLVDVNLAGQAAAWAAANAVEMKGDIFTLTLKVKADAPFGATEIKAAPVGPATFVTAAASVTITHECEPAAEYSKDADGHWYACTVEGCDKTPAKDAHTWTGCQEACPVCGQTRTVTHDYANAKFDNDNHWNECACGAKDGVTAHNFEEIVADEFLASKATCTSLAKYYKSCACGAVNKNDKFEAGALEEHTWDSTCDEACNECGFERVGTHTFDQTKSDATNHWNECLCGKKDDASVAAHAFKEVVDAQFLAAKANCQSPAKYYKTCDCGAKSTDTFENGEKDATVHANTEVKDAKPADCKTEGYTGDTYCVDENKKIADGTKIEKTAHTFGEWVVTKEATKEEEGSKERTCTVCKTEKETAKIDKLPASTGVATGDTFNAVLWTVLSFTSVAVLAAVVYFKKREGNRA